MKNQRAVLNPIVHPLDSARFELFLNVFVRRPEPRVSRPVRRRN